MTGNIEISNVVLFFVHEVSTTFLDFILLVLISAKYCSGFVLCLTLIYCTHSHSPISRKTYVGVTARYRHLLEDVRCLVPHHKKESKLDPGNDGMARAVNDICEIRYAKAYEVLFYQMT